MKQFADTPFELSGRICFIAGAAGLLGKEFSQALASAGATLVMADKEEKALNNAIELVRAKYPKTEILSCVLDVTDKASCDSAVDRVEERFGTIDVLVNSSAMDAKFERGSDVSKFSRFTDFPLEMWSASIEVNLTGAFLLTQSVARLMEKSGRGSIINIGSNYGLVGPDQKIYKREGESDQTYKPAVYTVCKAGLLGFTKYLATYYAGTNIRTNLLTPAGVFNNHDPEFVRNYSRNTTLGRMSKKEEYWGAVIFLASDASSYMTGANLVIDGGWTAL